MNTVDWERPILFERTVKGEVRRESRFLVTCGCCGEQRLLKRIDAKKVEQTDAPCYPCTQREKGKRGYQATIERHGQDFFLNIIRERELTNPPVLTRALMDILDNVLFIPYEREIQCGRYLIDFVIGDRFAIEVNGGVHVLHAERDARKAQFLREQGYELLVLEQADMPDAADRVREFLGVADVVYA